MKNKLLLLCVIAIFVILGYVYLNKANSKQLISPQIETPAKTVVNPSPTPEEVHYDSKTDLKGELGKINPQVPNSAFEPLEKLIDSL